MRVNGVEEELRWMRGDGWAQKVMNEDEGGKGIAHRISPTHRNHSPKAAL